MKYFIALIVQIVTTSMLACFFHHNIPSYHYDMWSYFIGLISMVSFNAIVDLFELYKKLK